MIEFQVIVLAAGKGSRITELTARKPKCLLPIGNRPMLYYPLKKIEESGFRGNHPTYHFNSHMLQINSVFSRGVPRRSGNGQK